MAAPTVLLADDDPTLTEVIAEFLAGHGIAVSCCRSGTAAVEFIQATPPDLVILDLNMPGLDGLSVCRTVRPFYSGRILMLTALVDDIDEVAGLETGADDYVRKPVRPRVLLARIRTLLRRAPISSDLSLGPLHINVGARQARIAQQALELTDSEFDLLHTLARSAGAVVTRDALYQQLRGIPWDGLDRSIDLRISRLRARLAQGGGSAEWIRSVRGEGYLLIEQPR